MSCIVCPGVGSGAGKKKLVSFGLPSCDIYTAVGFLILNDFHVQFVVSAIEIVCACRILNDFHVQLVVLAIEIVCAYRTLNDFQEQLLIVILAIEKSYAHIEYRVDFSLIGIVLTTNSFGIPWLLQFNTG